MVTSDPTRCSDGSLDATVSIAGRDSNLERNPLSFDHDFDGLHVLITGGTRGIGNAIARAYASLGARVVVTGRKEALAIAAASAIPGKYRALGIGCDNSIESAIFDLFSTIQTDWGELDIVVNNAGMALPPRPLMAVTAEELHSLYALNVFAPVIISSRAAEMMATQMNGGCILNISSVSGYGGARYLAAYASTKAALINLTKSMAREWIRHNIRVNALSLGPVRTDMFDELMVDIDKYELERGERLTSLVAEPNDVIRAVLYMTSPQASYLTGEDHILAGGYVRS